MSTCRNKVTVDYIKLDNTIEELSKGKTNWEDGFTSDINADYNIWIDCDVHREFSGTIVITQHLNIKEYRLFDKLTGLPTYNIEFDPNTLIELFDNITDITNPCEAPTTPTIDNITNHTVVISWPATDALFYHVRYKTKIATWNIIKATDNNITLTGLIPSTDYVCQVQSVCQTNKATSEWSTTIAFTTKW